MLSPDELAEIRRNVVREKNPDRLRRWCIALLEDWRELDRQLVSLKPPISTGIVNSTIGRDNAARSTDT